MATDLFGRGMDIERVNIVFNYDMPENSDTYLHRVRRTRGGGWLSMFDCELSSSLKLSLLQVARAGRFGTKGLAITFVSDEVDAKVLNSVQDRFEVNITELPDEIDATTYSKCSSCYAHMFTHSIDLKRLANVLVNGLDSQFNAGSNVGYLMGFASHGLCPCG